MGGGRERELPRAGRSGRSGRWGADSAKAKGAPLVAPARWLPLPMERPQSGRRGTGGTVY